MEATRSYKLWGGSHIAQGHDGLGFDLSHCMQPSTMVAMVDHTLVYIKYFVCTCKLFYFLINLIVYLFT